MSLLTMDFSNGDFEKLIPQGNRLALARFLTLVENKVPRIEPVKSALFKLGGKSKIIGITGSPGSGKSTLVDSLCQELLKQKKKIAILAVDPSSPYSGGAVLGDRIRMTRAAESGFIFIRSIATRGYLGGLSKAAYDLVQIFDSAQFDYIIIETVGVGQAEVDIAKLADSCVLVLVPGLGDSVQALKAGILEVADVFVLNKADHEGIDRLQKDIRMLISLGNKSQNFEPDIVQTTANKDQGTKELILALNKHTDWLKQTKAGSEKKVQAMKETILRLAAENILEKMSAKQDLETLALECVTRKRDPYSVVAELIS